MKLVKDRGMLDIRPNSPNAIAANLGLLTSPEGILIAINALLVHKLGGRLQFTQEELVTFLKLNRTLVQDNVNLRLGGMVVELSLLSAPPPPHRDTKETS